MSRTWSFRTKSTKATAARASSSALTILSGRTLKLLSVGEERDMREYAGDDASSTYGEHTLSTMLCSNPPPIDRDDASILVHILQ